MTLHLNYGIWSIDIPRSTDSYDADHVRQFNEEELTNSEERFQAIEQSFRSFFEDWNKI